LRRLVRARSGDPVVDSHLEQRVTRLLAFLGPFETRYQVVTGGRVVLLDLAWPDRRVAVECDGWGAHGRSRARFESDRRRDNDLIAAGWTVVHLTSAMSDDEIRAAVARVLLRSAVG
jgi:very-short-patch-repair endonuclease